MTTTTRFLLVMLLGTAVPGVASAQLEIASDFAEPPPHVQVPVVQQPVVQQPVVVQPIQQPIVQEAAEPPHESDFDASISLGIWVEMFSLDELELTIRDPEIAALAGMQLGGWQGMSALTGPVLTGGMLSFGMRMDGWLRGPEVRLMFGGTEVESPWTRAPGSDLELSIRNAMAFRGELALGVQAPLGVFRPYLAARVSIGAAFVDVAVRDDRLGELGTENMAEVLAEVGGEAGFAFEITEGLELGLAARAAINQHGGESYGGMMTLNVIGD
jgi:hypothetical protein